jgi:hypothetical protein
MHTVQYSSNAKRQPENKSNTTTSKTMAADLSPQQSVKVEPLVAVGTGDPYVGVVFWWG